MTFSGVRLVRSLTKKPGEIVNTESWTGERRFGRACVSPRSNEKNKRRTSKIGELFSLLKV